MDRLLMASVSELSALKYENNLLRQQALQAQAAALQAAFQKLVGEQVELLALLREEAGVDETSPYNPATRSF